MTFGDPRLPERIWQKLIPVPFSGCWLWLGSVDRKGYGKVWYKGKARRVHRLMKRFRRTADHKCHEPSCANPDHTRDMTRSRNTALGNKRRARPVVHPFNG